MKLMRNEIYQCLEMQKLTGWENLNWRNGAQWQLQWRQSTIISQPYRRLMWQSSAAKILCCNRGYGESVKAYQLNGWRSEVAEAEEKMQTRRPQWRSEGESRWKLRNRRRMAWRQLGRRAQWPWLMYSAVGVMAIHSASISQPAMSAQ